jgi:hypothetical protein
MPTPFNRFLLPCGILKSHQEGFHHQLFLEKRLYGQEEQEHEKSRQLAEGLRIIESPYLAVWRIDDLQEGDDV